MNLQQYVNDATRTESRIDSIQTNQEALLLVMKLFIEAGNLLDMIKKNIFYGKIIDPVVWDDCITKIQGLDIQEIKSYMQHYRTDKQQLNINPRLFHAIVGIATESTELVEAVLKALDTNNDIDHINVREEFFDTMWYLLIGHDTINKNIDETLQMGFDKLRKRYPDKFTNYSAINRDIQAEREILESYDS